MAREHGMIETIRASIGRFAGEAVGKKIIEGCGKITDKSSKKEFAEWAKCAMEKLDELVDEETRFKIMESCGCNCIEVNKRVVEKAKARRRKHRSIDEFLEAEQKNPMRGTRLVREGKVLYQYYTPKSFTRPLRCYCGVMRGLSPNETVSLTYCHCSKGFVQKLWESVLERSLGVEVLQSAISGAEECKFAIHI
jgi:hypothetical protein